MLGVNSCVKQNPCQVNKRGFGLMQVTLFHWFQQLKAGDLSSQHIPNWSSALVYSKEVAGSLFNHKTCGSYIKSIVIPGELVVPEGSKKEKYYSVLRYSELQMWQVGFRTAILCISCNITSTDVPWKRKFLIIYVEGLNHWKIKFMPTMHTKISTLVWSKCKKSDKIMIFLDALNEY